MKEIAEDPRSVYLISRRPQDWEAIPVVRNELIERIGGSASNVQRVESELLRMLQKEQATV